MTYHGPPTIDGCHQMLPTPLSGVEVCHFTSRHCGEDYLRGAWVLQEWPAKALEYTAGNL